MIYLFQIILALVATGSGELYLGCNSSGKWVLLFTCVKQSSVPDAGELADEISSATGLDVETMTLTNWASNVEKTSIFKVQPETREQVSEVVSLSRQHETLVRVAGATHSFSDLFPDSNSVWLDMSRFGLDEEDRLFISYSVNTSRTHTKRETSGSCIVFFMAGLLAAVHDRDRQRRREHARTDRVYGKSWCQRPFLPVDRRH